MPVESGPTATKTAVESELPARLEAVQRENRLLQQENDRLKEENRNLQFRKTRMRTLVEHVPQLVWTCAPDGRCDYVGPQLVAYTGRPETEQLGFGWLDNVHAQDRERALHLWTYTVRNTGVFDMDLRIRRHDGEYRWFKMRAAPCRDQWGDISNWVGTATDVNEQVVTEQQQRAHTEELEALVFERTRALREASERLSAAAVAARIGIWDWDIVRDEINRDAQLCALYGIERSSFAGAYDAWIRAVHPHDAPSASAALQKALRGEQEYDTRFRVLTPHGEVRTIQARAVVLRDADGKPVRMIGANWDVSNEMEIIERLEQSERVHRHGERLLNEFIDRTPAAIAVLDNQMRYVRVSERWITDYGLEGRDIIGRSHYEVFPDIPQHWKDIHARVLAGAVEACPEDAFPRADGSVEWLQWETRPWRDVHGKIGGLIFFSQVITRRKEMEIQLKEQYAQIERSNRELDQFAYVASHDLQEPLRAITGCGHILSHHYGPMLDDDARTLIRHMTEGATRMKALIRGLLDIARVTQTPPAADAIDTARALSLAQQNLRATLETRPAVVRHGALPPLVGNEVQLIQVFQNLIGNAIKYARAGVAPEIEVSHRELGPQIELRVRDNGIGIDRAHTERVFDIFERLHDREAYPGTGIGLSLCKKIVEHHGGRIWVEPQAGPGTTVAFSWPCTPPPPQS